MLRYIAVHSLFVHQALIGSICLSTPFFSSHRVRLFSRSTMGIANSMSTNITAMHHLGNCLRRTVPQSLFFLLSQLIEFFCKTWCRSGALEEVY